MNAMNQLEQAARMALEALETRGEHHPRVYRAIEALRAALEAEQPAGEPVAWLYKGEPWFDGNRWHDKWEATTDERVAKFKDKNAHPLYPAPQPATQEPVAWMDNDGNVSDNNDHGCFNIPLYTDPQPDKEPEIVAIEGVMPKGLGNEPEILAEWDETKGNWHRQWHSVGAWLWPGDVIAVFSDQFRSAAKMVQSAKQDDADPNAPWLTQAHMLCTDMGIPPGHITERLEALREKLTAKQPLTEEQIKRIYSGDFGGPDYWLRFARAIESAHGINTEKI